jgi:hypothetical protein
MSDPSQVPKLPGYHMEDPTTRKTTRVKTLEYKSGFTYVHPLEGNDNSRSGIAQPCHLSMLVHMQIPTVLSEAPFTLKIERGSP